MSQTTLDSPNFNNKNNKYDSYFVDTSIKRFPKSKEKYNTVLLEVPIHSKDYKILSNRFKENPKNISPKEYISNIVGELIIDELIKMEKDDVFEVEFKKETLRQLNGIMFTWEKEEGRFFSFDEFLSLLIEKEFKKHEFTYTKNVEQLSKIINNNSGR